MRPAAAQCVDPGLDDVFRRVEIRLPDFQMDDLPPFGFKGAGPHQNFKSSLGAEPLHAVSEPQGKTRSVCGGVKFGSRGCHGAPILFAAEPGPVQPRKRFRARMPRPRLPDCIEPAYRTTTEKLPRQLVRLRISSKLFRMSMRSILGVTLAICLASGAIAAVAPRIRLAGRMRWLSPRLH